jgi:hypothetical protein
MRVNACVCVRAVNALDGSYIRLASQVKDVAWASWTCTFGWPVQGE